jgi:imidazolonepropionase-like amidohydrolase
MISRRKVIGFWKSTPCKIILCLCFPLALSATSLAQKQTIVIESTTLINGRTGVANKDVSILIEGEKIKAVGPSDSIDTPEGAQRIDGRNKWVIPGIVELHSHATEKDVLRRALSLGVTTAHTITNPDHLGLAEWSNVAENPSPRLQLTTGLFGEFPDHVVPGRYRVKTPKNSTEARRDVAEVRLLGASAVKIWQDDGQLWFGPQRQFPVIPPNALKEIVQHAHRLGMRVYQHAWRLRFATEAVAAGVDALIHPVGDEIVDDALWEEMRRKQIPWTTTMAAIISFGDPANYAHRILSDARLRNSLSDAQREQFEQNLTATTFPSHTLMPALAENRQKYMDTIKRNTLRARTFGITIALGCDESPGLGTHIEMELLAEAGLSPAEILVAATHGSSLALRLDDIIGTIEEGKFADLVVLGSDPTVDIRNTRDIKWIMKGGRLFDPDGLLRGNRRP